MLLLREVLKRFLGTPPGLVLSIVKPILARRRSTRVVDIPRKLMEAGTKPLQT
jgi:hypothetical protein